MDKSDVTLSPLPDLWRTGQVVLSVKGRDRGKFYVVVGLPDKNRLALADADRFNVSRPKKKNIKHVQATQRCASELTALIEAGKNIDRGRFCQILAGLGCAEKD